MSQADATKYKILNQRYYHNHNNNDNNHQLTMRHENKRSAAAEPNNVALYENFIIDGDNNNKLGQHLAVDAESNKSTTLNNDYRFVGNGTNDAIVATNTTADCNAKDKVVDYENFNFQRHLQLDKRILLQKYFRTALVGPRDNIYENLCRGCNYGVFTARGPLCSFCECIVNGVNSISGSPAASSNNIYENICEHCAQFYSGNEDECQCRKKTKELQVTFRETEKEVQTRVATSVNKVGGSEELLKESQEDVDVKKNVKVRKSKSFNKAVRPKLLTNFWDTLRKTKTPPKPPLEIVHNVEGYDQVFHTKETFDLQRICELKRSVTSCSDQHIYGRLKHRDLVRSQEDFLSTQSLVQAEQKVKRSRVSKPKFLRSLSDHETQPVTKSDLELRNAQNPQFYLNASVCQWMTSLRHQAKVLNGYPNSVNTCNLSLSDEDSDAGLCYPKSIPARNLQNITAKAPVTNRLNIYTIHLQNHGKNVTQEEGRCYDTDSSDQLDDSTEIVALRRHNCQLPVASSLDSVDDPGETQQQQVNSRRVVALPLTTDRYQQMVDEFKLHLLNKQMKHRQQQQHHQRERQKYDKMVNHSKDPAGVNDSVSGEIPLRLAIPAQHNRAKRQGMYLRLGEDQHNLQNPEYESLDLIMKCQRAESNNSTTISATTNSGSNVNNSDKQLLTNSDISDGLSVDENTQLVSQAQQQPQITSARVTDKRAAVHEHTILQAFEALLKQENPIFPLDATILNFSDNESHTTANTALHPYDSQQNQNKHCTEEAGHRSSLPLSHSIKVEDLSKHLQLSYGLNTIVISYDKYLCVFLRSISSARYGEKYKHTTYGQLLSKYQRFHSYCTALEELATLRTGMTRATAISLNAKPDLMKANATGERTNHNRVLNVDQPQQKYATEIPANESPTTGGDEVKSPANVVESNELKPKSPINVLIRAQTSPSLTDNLHRNPKKPPEVPKRDPSTKLSPTKEQLPPVPIVSVAMTVPSSNLIKETNSQKSQQDEENIYQRIWKCKTVGEVQERFKTDENYYDVKDLQSEKLTDASSIPEILISEEDHSEWEQDDEFVFTSKPLKGECNSLTDQNNTIKSNRSINSSIGSTSLSGSTITDFASSTATLASCVSSSLKHHLFRNICIFYSPERPDKLHAIIYDYDRIHSSKYFAKPVAASFGNVTTDDNINDSGLGKSPTPPKYLQKSPIPVKHQQVQQQSLQSINTSESLTPSEAKAADISNMTSAPPATPPVGLSQLTKSVEAWKHQMLSVNYMEDEEDMIVSESEILRATNIKEEVEPQPPAPPQLFIQRFKSRSTDNILDLPLEDDKRSFGDRVRDKLQRGILNINNKSSPKSEKRLYKAIRNAQTTSLYLEEGVSPKYPIFGARLDQLELNQTTCPNVPRFVADSVEYIERKDRIIQDGLYRACGNKFSIDELKQKLSTSYIYDPKLITADDIHTIASLLKLFFRDLPQPLIPQETYNRLARDLTLNEGIDSLRIAINEMPEPNKSTLGFLIKHLTNVAACSSSNRMHASNLAIVWGPSLFTLNEEKTYDIGRMNTLAKVLIENYDRIFHTNERLL